MSTDRFPPDDPREWLRLARGDAAIAHADVPEAPMELLCFHAQQAAEKAIKAVLLAQAVPFPRTHNLQLLLDLCDERGIAVPDEVRAAVPLTLYAVLTRYPLPSEPVSVEELAQARERAGAVLDWATSQISPETVRP